MTVLMYLAPRMGMPKMDIIGMLGMMITSNEGAARILRTSAHFMMGAIFGAIHGVVAIIMMPLMLRMHPRPPSMELGPMMMAGLLMGHLVFGLVVAWTYNALL